MKMNDFRDNFCPELSAAEILAMECDLIQNQVQEMIDDDESETDWPAAKSIAGWIIEEAQADLWRQEHMKGIYDE